MRSRSNGFLGDRRRAGHIGPASVALPSLETAARLVRPGRDLKYFAVTIRASAAAVPAVIAIFASLLWIRSLFRFDAFVIHRDMGYVSVQSKRGMLAILIGNYPQSMARTPPNGGTYGFEAGSVMFDSAPVDSFWAPIDFWYKAEKSTNWIHFLGFAIDLSHVQNPKSIVWIYVPDWIVLLPSIAVAWRFSVLMKRRRQNASLRAGLCPACGYDLRGAEVGAASQRLCPECGLLSTIPPTR